MQVQGEVELFYYNCTFYFFNICLFYLVVLIWDNNILTERTCNTSYCLQAESHDEQCIQDFCIAIFITTSLYYCLAKSLLRSFIPTPCTNFTYLVLYNSLFQCRRMYVSLYLCWRFCLLFIHMFLMERYSEILLYDYVLHSL